MIELRPTTQRWIERACAELEPILVDHAHCEKKAAATALGFVFRCPERVDLVTAMSKLAREELLHFERLLIILKDRNIVFRRFPPSDYAAKLIKFIRAPRNYAKNLLPQIVDELLIAGIIESRSTERFHQLMNAPIDAGVRELFAELAEVEARHGSVYIELAETFTKKDRVAKRVAELIEFEASILENPDEPIRLHAG